MELGMNFYLVILFLMLILATMDLIVGVANDAVNFLSAAIGSKTASFNTAMIVASLGILLGVTFSSGMMEVARKGIFHPEYFTMPEIMFIFLAVMLTDVFLLDLFNTFGLPTSTTVSLVFDLLGAGTAVSIVKILEKGQDIATIGQYINTSKVSAIILSILLSVVLAFITATIIQFFTRLLFTFDFQKRLKRYGALWASISISFIIYFILIKGAKGASFITPDMQNVIKYHAPQLVAAIFVFFAVVFQFLILLNVNVLKFVVLSGTFALAMAFAANDLVNFIGVPLSSFTTYALAKSEIDPLTTLMVSLQTTDVKYETWIFLVAGLVMCLTLWFSKKAKHVSNTAISLGRQQEGIERFEPSGVSRIVVRMSIAFANSVKAFIPLKTQSWIRHRMAPTEMMKRAASGEDVGMPSFDLLRASVNLMVASALISVGTSYKLPLSTTFVTFMVGMGSSLADQAWGRESAVYRVTGVLTVVSSWFVTALLAFTISFIFAFIFIKLKIIGMVMAFSIVGISIWRTHISTKKREKQESDIKVFNLRKVTNAKDAVETTFEHLSILLFDIEDSLKIVFNALFSENLKILDEHKRNVKKVQWWTNVIMANIFKSIRIMQIKGYTPPLRYAETVTRLQRISDTYRDIVLRSYVHVANNHKGLIPDQVDELRDLKLMTLELLHHVATALRDKNIHGLKERVTEMEKKIDGFSIQLNGRQLPRIVGHSSKTRLTILYYSLIGDCLALARQNIKIIEIFESTFNELE